MIIFIARLHHCYFASIITGTHHFTGAEILENKQTAELLHKAIDQLTPQRKQAFKLVKIEGRSYEEAGQIMGVSRATINTHMTKATQSIKEYLVKNQDIAILIMSIYAASDQLSYYLVLSSA